MLPDFILVVVLLLNIRLLASSRLGAAIQVVALQGILVGTMPLLAHPSSPIWETLAISAAIIALKGFVFPRLLFLAVRRAEVSREMMPFIGYLPSLLIGVVLSACSFWIASRLPELPSIVSQLLLPAALSSILSGLFMLVARRLAISQILGFITLENGVFLFGAGAGAEISLLLEAGVLLDVFAAVFIMGVMIFRISREFDHIDAEKLSQLRD